jgi:hypothetical protein
MGRRRLRSSFTPWSWVTLLPHELSRLLVRRVGRWSQKKAEPRREGSREAGP